MKLLLLTALCIVSFAASANNWRVVVDKDPLSQQTGCLMMSAEKITKDGQTTTPVVILYNGNQFVVKTESNIDLSYVDSGLRVDAKNTHKIDRLYNRTDAVFEKESDQIRDEFIQGLRARLTFGFWPTWPKTHSHIIDFDLRGFTTARDTFLRCKKTGELPAKQQ